MAKVYFYCRLFLWNRCDHIQFIRIKWKKEHDQFRFVSPKLQDYGIFMLGEAYLLTNSYALVIFAMTLNFLWNADIISFSIVLCLLLYSILENPLPTMKFYKFLMGYVLIIISIKFVYQLPIFCGTPVFTFYSDRCNNEDITSQELSQRVDYIIGIHKYSGPSSYPRNVGTFWGILADIVLMLTLIIHKSYLTRIGAWNYVVLKDNIYKNPGFNIYRNDETNEDEENRFRNERLDYMADAHQQVYDYDDDPVHQKVGRWFLKIWYAIINFYGRVLP